jgi:F0F1-type ATP synthase membrane subunit a
MIVDRVSVDEYDRLGRLRARHLAIWTFVGTAIVAVGVVVVSTVNIETATAATLVALVVGLLVAIVIVIAGIEVSRLEKARRRLFHEEASSEANTDGNDHKGR